MKNLRDKKLALFFTNGISLKKWEEIGGLDREIKPYNFLANDFKKIYFITYGRKEELKFSKNLAKNIEILPKKGFLPSGIYQFFIPFIYRKELKETDIYKTNQMTAVIPAIISKWLYRKKLVIRCGYELLSFLKKQKKSFWKRKIASIIEKIGYRTADRIVLTSEEDKKYVEEKYHIDFEKINYIPNYIDTDLFRCLNIPKQDRICFVGRLEEQKNLFNLIRAISNLNIKLVIFGNGSQKKDLENFSKQLKTDVEFKGNIPNKDLPKEFNKSKLFILPSLYEGCPKVLLEAMACGLPVIGTNVYGTDEIIKHKENGYLCGTDSASIRKAITEVLNDKKLQEKMGINTRKTILENFRLEKILEKEIKIYQTL